ncbi:MAG: type II secretion system F family protein [Planctomycetota bacterium]
MGAVFEYVAHDPAGRKLTGRIDADDGGGAEAALTELGLRVQSLAPTQTSTPTAKPITGDELAAFNEQLLHLTKAGLPLEQGLRLIADDMGAGSAATVRELADKLDAGKSPEDAVAELDGKLPPLYGKLIAAGTRSGDLPGVLLGLGQHLDLRARLRSAVWRALTYPVVLLVALLLVGGFITLVVMPQFQAVFDDFDVELPAITKLVLAVGEWFPVVLGVGLVVLIGWPLVYGAFLARGRGQVWVEQTLMRVPLIGPVFRYGLVARWLNAAEVGVRGGLDLPAALQLADDAVGSPRLTRDSTLVRAAIERGGAPDDHAGHLRTLPPAVPAAMTLAAEQADLPRTLQTLSDLYRRRAEQAVQRLPLVLLPILLGVISLVVGVLLIALLAPLVTLIQTVAG